MQADNSQRLLVGVCIPYSIYGVCYGYDAQRLNFSFNGQNGLTLSASQDYQGPFFFPVDERSLPQMEGLLRSRPIIMVFNQDNYQESGVRAWLNGRFQVADSYTFRSIMYYGTLDAYYIIPQSSTAPQSTK